MARKTVRFYAMIDVGGDAERVYGDLDRAELVELLDEAIARNKATVEGFQGQAFIAKTLGKVGPAYCLALYKVSSQDLPMLYDESTRQIRPLDEVMGNEEFDIAEPTYFGFFPNGILGFVYNKAGPKPKQLMMYLGSLTNLEVDARPIPRRDVLEAVEQAGGVKAFSIKVPTADARVLGGTTLAEAADLAEVMQAGDIEVIFRARGDLQRQRLARRVQDVAPRLTERSRRQALKKLKVELETDEDYVGDRALDLLAEYFVIQRNIDNVPGRRFLDEREAVLGLAQAYRDLAASLRTAVGGMDPDG